MFAKYAYPVHVYRKKPNTWGDAPGVEDAPMPVLFDRPYSHTISEAVVAPRVTSDLAKAPHNMPMTTTGKNLYCAPEEDIRSDDYILYEDYDGKKHSYKVEGEGSNDFVSPFSRTVGGKEVFLTAVKSRTGR